MAPGSSPALHRSSRRSFTLRRNGGPLVGDRGRVALRGPVAARAVGRWPGATVTLPPGASPRQVTAVEVGGRCWRAKLEPCCKPGKGGVAAPLTELPALRGRRGPGRAQRRARESPQLRPVENPRLMLLSRNKHLG